LFRQSALGVALVGPDGRSTRCNPALQVMLGYSEAELQALPVTAYTHADDLELDAALFAELLAGERTSYRIEQRYVRKAGDLVWVRLTVSLVRGSADRVALAIRISEDVTQVRSGETRHQQVVQALAERVKELTALHRAARLLQDDGHPVESMLAQLVDLLPQAMQHPDIAAGRIRHGATVCASSRWCDSKWRIAVEFRAADDVAGALEIVYITLPPFGGASPFLPEEQSLLESMADMLRTELDRRHALHLRGELEEQLRRSQKLDAVGRLAAGVAHDFNNLLTVICSNCTLLANESGLSASQRELVREIEEVGERGASLTRQLLGVGRETAFDAVLLDPNALIRGLDGMLRKVIGKDVRMQIDLDGDLPRVRTDKGQLEQVLINLVLNARDAMPRGGVMRISTRNAMLTRNDAIGRPAGAYVEIAVADAGLGMSAEVRERLFEPFFTTKTADRGSGLGLAVVFGLVHQSSGHIEVDSVEGQGTTMRVYLPCAVEPGFTARARSQPHDLEPTA
jgi:PAS domain S-box-containing protein